MQTDHFNPVTRTLIQELNDPQLAEFIAYWDAVEALVVRIFPSQEVTAGDEAEYQQVRDWLGQAFPQWQEALRAYWPLTRIAGEPTTEDPFARLMAAKTAREFMGNWAAMQTLPAAREALNRWLMDLIDSTDNSQGDKEASHTSCGAE